MRKIYIVALATLSVLFSFVPAYAQDEIDVTKYFSITAISGAKTVKLQRTDANYNPSITKDTEFDLWYSTNNCATWTRWATPTSSTISIAKGTTVYFKGVNPQGFGRPDGICSWQFLLAGNYTFSVQGDIMSLVKGDFVDYGDGTTNFDTIPADYCFDKLFSQAHAKTYLTTAANLTLSAKYLTKGCYRQMFLGLIHASFTTTPSINAVDVQESAFESMFEGCTKLVNVASPLPQVETIPEAGFKRMFYNCNALKSTENISLGEQVKVIETEGCSQMFYTCNAANFTNTYNNFPNLDYIGESGCYQMYYSDAYLTSSPNITAKRLYPNACRQMFFQNYRMVDIGSIDVGILDDYACANMYQRTCSLTLAAGAGIKKIKIDSVGRFGCYQMFQWTGETKAPLQRSMFSYLDALDVRLVGDSALAELCLGCNYMTDIPNIECEKIYDGGFLNTFKGCTGVTHVGGFVCPEVGMSGCESTFSGCTALQTIEKLDIDRIGRYGCWAMFNGCAPLDSIPVKMMEIEQLGDSGCYQMFSGCKTYLTKIADLNVGEIGAGGCYQMFNGCAALTSIPAIKARKVGNKAMQQMFNGAATGQYAAASTILIDTVGVDGCYLMFDGVTKLNQIDSIGFRLVEDRGLYQMFRGCTSLATAPKIYAQRVDTQACTQMFDNCSALTSIPYFQIDTIGYQGCYNMFYNSTQAYHTKLTTFPSFKVKLIREEGCKYMFHGFNAKSTYQYPALTSFPNIEVDEVETNGMYQMFYRCTALASVGNIHIKKVHAHGLDLMFNDGDTKLVTVGNLTFDEVGDYGCSKMFSGCTALANIGNITVGHVGNHGMASMFTPSANVANVANVGTISIESLADSACFQMFYNSTKLATIPSLSIGKADEPISIGACEHMFSGCTVLNFTNAPVLSATNIGEDAYADMFLNCKALTNAPTALPAPTIPRYGYWEMFKGCVALENAPSLDAMTSFSGDSACYAMFSGCTKLSNFSQKLKPTTLRPATYYQMFVGCSSLKTAPEIDANLILYRACDSMFVGSGITAIPEMPNLTTIEDYGCKEMFRSCAGIRKMDNWHWDKVAPYGCQLMFVSCANLDTVTNLTINHVSHNGLDQMFSAAGIDTIGNIYTKKVDNQGCYRMFTGCTTLKKAGLLKADTVGYQGWYQMFLGASTTAGSKYDSISVGLVDTLGMQQMFYNCTGMTQAPSLCANKLDSAALNLLFERCTGGFTMNSFVVDTIEPMACCKMCTTYVASKVTFHTKLTAINNPIRVKIVKPLGCYQMFQSPGLLSLPAMRADTIQERGCYQMTKGSSGLNTIGDLQAAFLQDSACAFMFNTCTALKNIGTLTAKYDNASAYYQMFFGCPIATFGNIEVDTIRPYAYNTLFNNLANITNFGKIKANVVMEHGLDGLFRNSTKLVSVDSIILGDVADSACYEMFKGCTALTSIPYLKIGTEGRRVGLHALCRMFQGDKKLDILETPLLPASKLKNGAYEQMFETCEALTHAPLLLNADSVGTCVYKQMFNGCKLLPEAPATLPLAAVPHKGYFEMFKGCLALPTAPSLDAMTTMADSVCYGMFNGCVALTQAPQMLKPAVITPTSYYQMFAGCSALQTAPSILATTADYRACDSMFVGSGLTLLPQMENLRTINEYGCKEMFRSCNSLTQATDLTFDYVAHNGAEKMFATCTALDTIGNIYTKDVDYQGCYQMFTGCTALKKAGLLKADTVGYLGWQEMFNGCNASAARFDSVSIGLADTLGLYRMFNVCLNLNQGPAMYIQKADSAALFEMYRGCYNTAFTIPTIVIDTIEPYACRNMCMNYTEKISNKTYTRNALVSSIPNGIHAKVVKPYGCYQMFNPATSLATIGNMQADTIMERGCYQMTKGCTGLNTIGDLQAAFLQDSACAFMFNTCTALKNIGTLTAKYDNASAYYQMFYNCPIATFGNIEVDTIHPYAYKTLFNNLTSITNFGKIKANVVMEHGLDGLFRNSTKLVSVDSIILGDVADSACYEMFKGCTALTTIPYLKIGTEGRRVGLHALCRMFQGDKKLDILETPLLPASKLKNGAYEQMFETCEALTHAPLLLNADSVGTCVYKQMFNGCKLLPEAPATLPLAVVPHKGYFEMFKGCVALETAPSLDAMTSFSGDSACYAMFSGCTKLSSFSQKLKPTTLRPATYYQMFFGCSSLLNAPEIDAHSIPYRACDSMFVGSAITTIPNMPYLTTIEDYGCKEMFRNCAGLRKMDNWHWNDVAPYGCQLMFANCANLDTVTNVTIDYVSHNGLDQMFSAAGIDTIGNIYTKKVDNQGCYRMFTGCTTLKNAGLLKADTVGYQGWQEMFNGCSASAARFDSVSIGLADTLGLYRMFNVCLNLNQGPAMYIQKADSAALFEMYRGCYNTAFTIPTIVIDTIEPYACCNMCMNYTESVNKKPVTRNALVSSIPNGIHAKVVKPYGCYQMFNPASSLTTIGNLTADTIQEHGCYQMTESCSALTTIGDLQAQYLADSACAYMFNTASKLNTVGSLHTDKYANTSSFHQMFHNCPMVHIGSIITDTIHKGDFDVLFNSLTNLATFGCIKADVVLENGLKSWFAGRTKLTDVDSIILGDVRDSACYEMFKGCTLLDTIPYLQIGTMGKRVGKHALCRMFQGDTKLRIAKAPVLAATTLKEGAYQQMFENCSSLQYSPAYLPADSVGHLGYMQMFNGCAALITSPISLPLDVVSDSLYYQMFAGCSSLPVAVGTLGPSSVGKKGYYEMYKGCSSLVTAPQMPNLVSVGDSTCMGMYNGCQSLVNLGTWQPEHVGKSACQDMFSGCSSLADASPFRLKAETIDTLSFYRMFANCAALTTAPQIDAHFIEYRGCDSMFVSTPLTALPSMPNIELIADYGCKEMFRNCDALTEVKGLTIGEVAKNGMQQMFQDCGGLTEVSQLNLPKLDTMACYQMFASCSPQSVHDLTFGTMAYQSAYQMFNNNTNLASLYNIKANKIGKEAAKNMFQTCAKLTQIHDIEVNEVDTMGCQEMFSGSCKTATGSVHDIHVTTLRPNACQSVFASCTGLDSVYNLSAGTIGESACYLAFNGCTGIDTIGNLQATTIEANGCQQMFNSCTANLRIDQLKAKNVGEYGCYLMFNGCTQLSRVGTLEADVVGEHGWDRMFQGITKLKNTGIRAIVDTIRVNKIENNGCYRMFYSAGISTIATDASTSRLQKVNYFRANQVADSACFEMFRNCVYLSIIPDTLYAKTVGTDGYRNMFLSTVVTETPVIAATSLGKRACQSMFQSCSKLVTVNDLPCVNLSPSTYASMFNSCAALKNTPALPASHIPAHAYEQMFFNNTALNTTPDLTAMRVVGDSACYQMFYGCTALTTPSTMDLTSVGVSGCREMYCNCNNGNFRNIPNMSFGDVADYGCYLMFYGNYCNAYVGDITATSVGRYGMAQMFQGCQTNNATGTRGYTVGKLQLGDVGNHGCYAMFYSANVGSQKNASKIATIDTLVINTVGDSACYQMFYNCSFLATIPSHLAGNSAKSCYQEMFNACALLTSVPQLPAPTAEENCYYKMFNGCSVLPATPDLPATTLAPNCYAYMFSGCKAITAAPELNALQVPAAAYNYMFNGCTALKAAPNLPATKLADNCYAYMFNGCSVMDSVMETLPAAYLANNCYQNMFSSTAITTAPVLVASRFEDKEGNTVDNCYNAMFSGCSKLNTIKTYLDNFGEGNQTTNWVSGVPATGNFFCASSLPREYGASRIPQTDADGCRWTLNPLIRMVFNPNGGTWDGEDNSNRSFSPPLTSLPATQKPNCIFLRWDTLANGQGNYRFDWNNPLEGDYTYYAIYEPIDFKFTEWRDGKAIIQTTNTTATRCDIKAQDGEVVTPNILSNCAVSGSTGEYALSYDATDVLAHQGKLLNLTLRNNAGDTLGVLVTQIPFVISGNVNSSDLAPTNESDVWITNGATLTINDTREMQTLYVEGGGKIVVPEGQTLTTKRIILRAGEQNQDGEYSFCYPQVVANGSIMNATGIVNYDYLLSSAQYFNLCLPYDVNLADVLLCDGTTADKSMAIMYYDGEARTSGATGWKYLWNPKTSIGAYPTLKAGIGYTICCRAPQVTMTDGTKIRRTYSYLRLPMEADLSQGEVVIGDARTTDVVPYGMTDGALNPGVRANNAGWNLVGNPYLANFVVPEGLLSNNGVGLLELGDDNQYHWTGSVRYAVIPSNDGTNYTSEVINNYTFPAFKNFFVQIGTGDKLSFAKSHRVNVAPRQMQTDESTKEIMVGVTLSGNGETDRVGVLVGEDYSEEYELNADLDKWKNTGLNVYANIGKTDLAIAAIPAQIAQNIPLTVKVSKKGSYTFSIHNPWMSNASLMEHVYLYDSEERSVTDLLVESYTFTIASTVTNSSRFMLIAEPKKQPETPTTIQNLSLERPMVSANEGEISIVGLEDAKVSVYSITGTCLCDVSASETLNVAVPSGVYIVRIYQSGEMFSVQQIVK